MGKWIESTWPPEYGRGRRQPQVQNTNNQDQCRNQYGSHSDEGIRSAALLTATGVREPGKNRARPACSAIAAWGKRQMAARSCPHSPVRQVWLAKSNTTAFSLKDCQEGLQVPLTSRRSWSLSTHQKWTDVLHRPLICSLYQKRRSELTN